MNELDHADYERAIGRLEGRLGAVESALTELRRDVKSMRTTLSEARGSWKVLVWLAGGSAVIGGLLVKYAPLIGGLPK